MENKSTSKKRTDYEILIRKRGESEYSSYCPQLSLIIKGREHEEVAGLMEDAIMKHISELPE